MKKNVSPDIESTMSYLGGKLYLEKMTLQLNHPQDSQNDFLAVIFPKSHDEVPQFFGASITLSS